MLKDLSSQKKVDKQVVVNAIQSLQSRGWDINPYTVADEAKIPRSSLYRDTELMDLLSAARAEPVSSNPAPAVEGQEQLLELQRRNQELEALVKQLQEENEALASKEQQAWQLGYKTALAEASSVGETSSTIGGADPSEPAAVSDIPVIDAEQDSVVQVAQVENLTHDPTSAQQADELEQTELEPFGQFQTHTYQDSEPEGQIEKLSEEVLSPAIENVVQAEAVVDISESQPPTDWQEPIGEHEQAPVVDAVESDAIVETSYDHSGEQDAEPGELHDEIQQQDTVKVNAAADRDADNREHLEGEVYITFDPEGNIAAPTYRQEVADLTEDSNRIPLDLYEKAPLDEGSDDSAEGGNAEFGQDLPDMDMKDEAGFSETAQENADEIETLPADPVSETALRDLVKHRFDREQQAAKDAESSKKLSGTKFVGGNKAATDAPVPQGFVVRTVPPDIRKACLILGLRPEELTQESVHKAWKKEITNPGGHPDIGGETEIAIYLNTAKDTLYQFLDAQAPKLGKKFGATREPPKSSPKPSADNSSPDQALE